MSKINHEPSNPTDPARMVCQQHHGVGRRDLLRRRRHPDQACVSANVVYDVRVRAVHLGTEIEQRLSDAGSEVAARDQPGCLLQDRQHQLLGGAGQVVDSGTAAAPGCRRPAERPRRRAPPHDIAAITAIRVDTIRFHVKADAAVAHLRDTYGQR
ncbi:hypothetical protein ACWEGQ_01380 [Streptomyces seoulensis]